jgi:outer membrane lipoprotein SlyB
MLHLIIPRRFTLLAATIPYVLAAAHRGPAPSRVCIAPPDVEAGDASGAADAVRETFTSYLTGPSMSVAKLESRLASQAREEAKSSRCPYVLFTQVSHVRKTSTSNGLLGRMAGSAVQQGAYTVGSAMGSTVGRVAANAAGAAAGVAAYNYATTVKTKDELTLGTRLESASGQVLVDRTEKRKAQSDGEDLLTPLVAKAAEAIATAVKQTPQEDKR